MLSSHDCRVLTALEGTTHLFQLHYLTESTKENADYILDTVMKTGPVTDTRWTQSANPPNGDTHRNPHAAVNRALNRDTWHKKNSYTRRQTTRFTTNMRTVANIDPCDWKIQQKSARICYEGWRNNDLCSETTANGQVFFSALHLLKYLLISLFVHLKLWKFMSKREGISGYMLLTTYW